MPTELLTLGCRYGYYYCRGTIEEGGGISLLTEILKESLQWDDQTNV